MNKAWNTIAFSGNLWTTLHPSRWGLGDWSFGEELSSDDCNCDCEPNYELFTFLKYEIIFFYFLIFSHFYKLFTFSKV